MKKELKRSATDCKIFGVCGGIAQYLGIDSNVVRLVWIAISLFAGSGVFLYIIAAFLLPKDEPSEADLKDVRSCGRRLGGGFAGRSQTRRTGSEECDARGG